MKLVSGDYLATHRGREAAHLWLWKAADPDILILKQAKAEYAKLQ